MYVFVEKWEQHSRYLLFRAACIFSATQTRKPSNTTDQPIVMPPPLKMVSVQSSTHCIVGNFHDFLSSADFFKIYFFEKFFHEHHQCVKQFGSRSGPTFCRPNLGPSKRFAKIISRQHQPIKIQVQKHCFMLASAAIHVYKVTRISNFRHLAVKIPNQSTECLKTLTFTMQQDQTG